LTRNVRFIPDGCIPLTILLLANINKSWIFFLNFHLEQHCMVAMRSRALLPDSEGMEVHRFKDPSPQIDMK
jgi:hypothetical protein